RLRRYVRFEWPWGNCSMLSKPAAPGNRSAKYASSTGRGSSSPSRTGAVSWLCDMSAPRSPIRPEGRILQMRQRVEAVESEAALREHELGKRAVPHAPVDFEGHPVRRFEGEPDRRADDAARGKDHHAPA